MKAALTVLCLMALPINYASATGGSADRMIFDQPMDGPTCLAKIQSVAKAFGLAAQIDDPNSNVYVFDANLLEGSGESAGTAYYQAGICHIYVK